MDVRRNLLVLFLCIAAANSLPNLFNDWDSQELASDILASSEVGLPDLGWSEPQDNTNLFATGDGYPSIIGDLALGDPGLDGVTTSPFQDLSEGALSKSTTPLEDGDTLLSLPATDDKVELALDDICPLGHWNRCCYNGLCFWGMFV